MSRLELLDDFLVIPKAEVQNCELILAETPSIVLAAARGVSVAACAFQEVGKSSPGKPSALSHP
ncbi:MAG TPA: hypothetical protein VFC46_04385 [Humisphaera sp.]|nr:hypothetical protein [Humisphaera sp.]